MAAMLPNDDDEQETPFDADGNQVSDDNTATTPDDSDSSPNPGDVDVEENEDGSATVKIAGEKGKPVSKDFYENLAEELIPENVLLSKASELLDLIEQDKLAREKRDEQYEEGIKRTGLGNEAPGGASFAGASRVVHPVLIEGCIDFSARAMKELCPPAGPVRTKIMGKATPAKVDKAERKRQFMNWQLTKKIQEYKPETEKMLTQLPMGGSQYKKWWYDHDLKRPCMEFVPIDNVFLPFAATSFYTAERITHWQKITQAKFDSRVDSGFYRDINLIGAPATVDESKSEIATAKVEGKEDSGLNQDGTRSVYEVSFYDDFEEDDKANGVAPYIMHIDESSGKVLALYRNWDESDEEQERLHWLIESVFIPWRGIYGLGLPHIIGSLSGAITGSIRAILDNALAQTKMGGLRLKGNRGSGTSVSANPTEFTELDSGVTSGQDDIRKMAMFAPINQMPPVLFQVTQWLVEQAKGVVAVADEKIGESKNDMPMGTALALIEQGSITFSQIHARLHDSQMRELEVLHRLNRWFLSDKEVVEDLGDLVVSREDFEGPMDVIPVSDPNIFSETQRYAQMQAVIGLMNNPLFLPMFKPDQVLDRALQLMGVPNREELLNIKPHAEDLNPVSENLMVALQEQPIKAFAQQDHMAHIQVHLSFATSPLFGANPAVGPKLIGPIMDHVFQHIVMYYAKHMEAAKMTGKALGMPSESEDDAYAVVVQHSDQLLAQHMQKIQPMLQKAQQLAQQASSQQKPPLDPQSQVAMADVERKKAYDQAELQRKDKEFEFNQKMQQQQLAAQTKADDDKLKHGQLLEGLVQQQKDSREQIEQQAKDQRERLKLAQEAQKAELEAHTKVVTTQIQSHVDQQTKVHADKLDHLHNILSTHLEHVRETENLRQQREAEEKKEKEKAATEATKEPAKPAVVQMDPEHTKALQDLVKNISYTQRAHQLNPPKDGAAETAKTIAIALAQLGKYIQDMSASQSEANKQLATTIASTVANALGQHKQDLQTVAKAAQASGAGHQAVISAVQNLEKTVRAPRKRTLTKDKKGGKVVIDTIDDGNE